MKERIAADQALIWESEELERAKHPDTAETFSRACEAINARITPAAQPFRREIPLRTSGIPKVAFFTPSGDVVANVANLATYFRGLQRIKPTIDASVVTLTPPSQKFVNAFEGVPWRVFSNPSPLQSWEAIQQWGIEQHLDAFVHVSHTFGLAFSSIIRCARTHLWWSMKWRYEGFAGVDGYLDGTGADVSPPWIKTYSALPDFFRPEFTAQAKDIRARLKGGPIFGTICREEKITPEFIEAVRKLLTQLPGSRFVYSGKKAVPALELLGANFLGWVAPALWAQIIEVFLDTWPFPSGHTAWEVVAAKRPIVMMEPPPDPRQAWVAAHMRFAGHPYCAARNIDEYVEIALRMARGELAEFVDSNYAFYQSHLRDEKRMAEEVTAAILRVLGSKSEIAPN